MDGDLTVLIHSNFLHFNPRRILIPQIIVSPADRLRVIEPEKLGEIEQILRISLLDVLLYEAFRIRLSI